MSLAPESHSASQAVPVLREPGTSRLRCEPLVPVLREPGSGVLGSGGCRLFVNQVPMPTFGQAWCRFFVSRAPMPTESFTAGMMARAFLGWTGRLCRLARVRSG